MITNQGDATDATRRTMNASCVMRPEGTDGRKFRDGGGVHLVILSLCQQNGPEMKGLASGMGIENRN